MVCDRDVLVVSHRGTHRGASQVDDGQVTVAVETMDTMKAVSVGALAALATVVVAATGCSLSPLRHVREQKEMTWKCVPELSRADSPGYQAVRFRFVQDPRYGEVNLARGLCDQLTSAGKAVVLVDFEAWGNSSQGLVGYREITIDQRAVIPGTGSTSFFEQHDPAEPRGQHPLSTPFK